MTQNTQKAIAVPVLSVGLAILLGIISARPTPVHSAILVAPTQVLAAPTQTPVPPTPVASVSAVPTLTRNQAVLKALQIHDTTR